MSRVISPAMAAHLAGDVQTLAHLWLVTRKDGARFGYTDHDSDIVFGGVTYLAASGFTASNVQSSAALNVDNLEVAGMLSSASIQETDLMAGLWDYASVSLSFVNYKDLTMGAVHVKAGTLGQIRVTRGQFVAELRGLTQPLQQSLLEFYSPGCRANFADARCKVNPAPWTVTGSVAASGATNNQSWSDPALTQTTAAAPPVALQAIQLGAATRCYAPWHGITSGAYITIGGATFGTVYVNLPFSGWQSIPILPPELAKINGLAGFATYIDRDNFYLNCDSSQLIKNQGSQITLTGAKANLSGASEYFTGGLVTWLTGANAGLSMEVQTYVPGYVKLFEPMPHPVVAGDTYTIRAGCDKLLATCRNKFSNAINFRGEPWIPGSDQLMQHP